MQQRTPPPTPQGRLSSVFVAEIERICARRKPVKR